jgi:uncharacterized membrane protein
MALLILGIILFLGLHLLPTVPNLRNYLIGRLGERPYRALFGVLSVAAFVVLARHRVRDRPRAERRHQRGSGASALRCFLALAASAADRHLAGASLAYLK